MPAEGAWPLVCRSLWEGTEQRAPAFSPGESPGNLASQAEFPSKGVRMMIQHFWWESGERAWGLHCRGSAVSLLPALPPRNLTLRLQ